MKNVKPAQPKAVSRVTRGNKVALPIDALVTAGIKPGDRLIVTLLDPCWPPREVPVTVLGAA